MLSRTLARLVPSTVAVAALVLVMAANPVYADETVVCPPSGGSCYIVVTGPGQPGGGGHGGSGGGGGGGSTICSWKGTTVPCYDPGWGYFNGNDGCYYDLEKPPPPAGDPQWQGHQPGDGAVYLTVCYPPDGTGITGLPGFGGVGIVWLATPPPGFGGGGPTPAQLAVQAINQLPIKGPDIGIAPNPAGAGAVGLPVWMWNNVSANTWGPVSATAAVPGLSVTATGTVTQIVWNMGDGGSVTCANPGTAYSPSFGNAKSPNCGYVYSQASTDPAHPHGRYTVTATSTWHVTWAGGGANGVVDVTRQSQTTVEIDEIQVVTR